MRTKLYIFAAIMTVLVAAASCSKLEENNMGGGIDPTIQNALNLTINSGAPDTKTYFEKDGDVYKSYWKGSATEGAGNGDMIRIFLGSNEGNQYTYVNNAASGVAASFQWYKNVSTPATLVEGEQYTVYGLHRNGRVLQKWNTGTGATTTTVAVEMLAEQNPTLEGPDGSSDFLIMMPMTFTYSENVPSTISSSFARVSSALRLKFKDVPAELAGKPITKVVLTATGSNIAGPAIVDLKENGGFIENAIQATVGSKKASKTITVTYKNTATAPTLGTDAEIFFNMVPALYTGDTFKFEIYAGELTLSPLDNQRVKITKTITPSSLEFIAGKATPIKISLATDATVKNPFYFEGTGGNGSSEDNCPYYIYTETDLRLLSALTNGDDAATWAVKTYRQQANITMSSDNFTPIARTTAFSGTYNGGNNTITGLNVSVTENGDNIGLFGKITNKRDGSTNNNYGRVMNLNVNNAVITTTAANNFVGVLVGCAEGGSITKCNIVNASCECAKNPAKGILLGGIQSNGTTISECSVASSTLTVTEGDAVGGLVGRVASAATITKCSVMGTTVIDADKSKGVGGIVGRLDKASTTLTVEECVVGSGVTIKGQQWIGGILGAGFTGEQSASTGDALAYSHKVIINNSAVYSNISSTYSGSQYLCVAGICGAATTCNNATATDSYFIIANSFCENSTITADSYTADANVNMGGILGKAGDKSATANKVYVVNSYTKDVKYSLAGFNRSNRWAIGGIVGGSRQANVIIGNCYTTLTPDDITLQAGIVSQIVPQIRSKAEYCFGLSGSSLVLCSNANPALSNSEQLTLAEFKGQSGTTNALVDKLTAGVSAHSEKYHNREPDLQAWTNSQDGYPILNGALADPDAATE